MERQGFNYINPIVIESSFSNDREESAWLSLSVLSHDARDFAREDAGAAALRAALSTAPSFPGPLTTAALAALSTLTAATSTGSTPRCTRPTAMSCSSPSRRSHRHRTLFHPEDIQDVIRAEGPCRAVSGRLSFRSRASTRNTLPTVSISAG